jgi:glycosyltransferase involved in cell wall biosynthesis
MIESISCGTPAVSYRRGSVSEVLEDGVSGLIVDSEDAAVEAVRRIGTLDRAGVRAAFERRFTVEHMARQYVELYRQLAS